MAYVSGTAGSVAYVSGGTTSIAGVHEWSIDIGQDTPEVTAFGDGWRNYVNGIKEWSGSFGVRKDPAVTAQDTVRGYLIGGSAPVVHRFYAGTNYYSGSVIVTGSSPELAFDGTWEDSFDFQGVGPLTYT